MKQKTDKPLFDLTPYEDQLFLAADVARLASFLNEVEKDNHRGDAESDVVRLNTSMVSTIVNRFAPRRRPEWYGFLESAAGWRPRQKHRSPLKKVFGWSVFDQLRCAGWDWDLALRDANKVYNLRKGHEDFIRLFNERRLGIAVVRVGWFGSRASHSAVIVFERQAEYRRELQKALHWNESIGAQGWASDWPPLRPEEERPYYRVAVVTAALKQTAQRLVMEGYDYTDE